MTYQYDLLDKRELRVTDIELSAADLGAVARVAADVLGVNYHEVFVTDYLDNVLTFDILRPTIDPHQVIGRAQDLLAALRVTAGVTVSSKSRVTSNGMLGWIAADDTEIAPMLADAQRIAAQLSERVSRRVAVFSTGAEMVVGDVKDTNWESISEVLGDVGFDCVHMGTLPDDEQLIAGSIRRAVGTGFGTVITTGGVGAESKDRTIEAVLSLTPEASTRYTCHFTAGQGRHTKSGVRIAVGSYQGCRLIALPGPNDEVRASLPHIVNSLIEAASNDGLATAIANTLRGRLRAHMHTEEQS